MTKKFLFQVIGALSLASGCLWAQQAEVSGFVHDPGGAVVANAVVSIQNTATNSQLKTKSNDSGVYTLLLLPPGVYRLTVNAPGFAERTIQDIRLEVAAKVALNIDLAIGGLTAAASRLIQPMRASTRSWTGNSSKTSR
jgi:hypothetical protein